VQLDARDLQAFLARCPYENCAGRYCFDSERVGGAGVFAAKADLPTGQLNLGFAGFVAVLFCVAIGATRISSINQLLKFTGSGIMIQGGFVHKTGFTHTSS
jgi:hypothetical protein